MSSRTITTPPRSVWVVRYANRFWAVLIEGQTNPVFIYRAQTLAIAHGIALARNRRCQLIIQNRGAKSREKDN